MAARLASPADAEQCRTVWNSTQPFAAARQPASLGPSSDVKAWSAKDAADIIANKRVAVWEDVVSGKTTITGLVVIDREGVGERFYLNFLGILTTLSNARRIRNTLHDCLILLLSALPPIAEFHTYYPDEKNPDGTLTPARQFGEDVKLAGIKVRDLGDVMIWEGLVSDWLTALAKVLV